MITFERTTGTWDGRSDDVDQVLSSYFKSRMPNPWPAFAPRRSLKPATAMERSTRASRWQWHSRLLLIAASVGLLLAAKFLLPSYVPKDHLDNAVKPADTDINQGTATTDYNKRIITDEFFEIEGGSSSKTMKIRIDAYPDPGSSK